jgi:dienelactone hydrolase
VRIILVGASMGGTASLVAAHGIVPTVAGVASLSGPANYAGMDALTTVKSLTVPVLFMAAANDQAGGFDFPADARTM